MKLIFTDNQKHVDFKPLSLTRPIANLRFGILTIEDSWLKTFEFIGQPNVDLFYDTEDYLQTKFPRCVSPNNVIKIAGNIKPSIELVKRVNELKDGDSLYVDGCWIATLGDSKNEVQLNDIPFIEVNHHWELFQKNGEAIQLDFDLLTKNRTSLDIPESIQVLGKEHIFIEEGAQLSFGILNATSGPIYIGKDAELMEGSIIRGPFALLDHATVKMGAKIYGPTTIGPHCKVGGEISNTIFQAYSNKGHDGFLGNALIGEWCNLGADTNSSNLKNNYGKVKLYHYQSQQMEQTPLQFCGVIMGDHSKTGINTMLNTATTVGVCANIFGGGFPPKFIPSFSWGGFKDSPVFKLEKAYEVAENMMKRRQIDLSEADQSILKHIFENQL